MFWHITSIIFKTRSYVRIYILTNITEQSALYINRYLLVFPSCWSPHFGFVSLIYLVGLLGWLWFLFNLSSSRLCEFIDWLEFVCYIVSRACQICCLVSKGVLPLFAGLHCVVFNTCLWTRVQNVDYFVILLLFVSILNTVCTFTDAQYILMLIENLSLFTSLWELVSIVSWHYLGRECKRFMVYWLLCAVVWCKHIWILAIRRICSRLNVCRLMSFSVYIYIYW